ncbi:MAG: acyltransferase, partial [Caulobacterales bacterium]
FLIDRAIRIYPLYWVATGLLILLFALGFRPAGLQAFDAGNVVTSFLLIPHVRADGEPKPILSLGWTLIYEAFFYVMFALTFFMRSQIRSALAIGGVFCALLALPLVFDPMPHALEYFTSALLLEFVVGALLAIQYDRNRFIASKALGWGAIALGVCTILALDLIADVGPAGNHWLRLVMYGLPATLIVAGALSLDRAGVPWSSRALLLLGASSYAIYLFHMLMLQPAGKIITFFLGGFGAAALPVAALLLLAGAALFGVLMHYGCERPLQRLLKARVNPKTMVAIAN